ncbi:MAG: exported protein of unknown function [Nitrospira sp.]|nr:exported protein of unknown function [Nitrospira sp.]
MNRSWPALGRTGLIACVMIAGPAALFADGQAESDNCVLPSHHAGVSFPLDQVEKAWACRLQPIISHYTTATKIGSERTPLPQDIFLYLLDHPVMAAALVNRLDFGLYKAEQRGPQDFWATDGEGTEGTIHPLYQEGSTRMYFAQGSHDGRLLPRVTGKAVVLLQLHPVTDGRGIESIDSTLVAYLRLDNRLLSGLLSLLRPLIESVVHRQLLKAFDAARLLGGAMREHPEKVLFEATDPPALPDEEVAFLKAALMSLHNPTLSPGPTP